MKETRKVPALRWVPVLPVCLVSLVTISILGAMLISGRLTGQAVQAPFISLDMDTTGNTYDDIFNTMAVGTVDFCLEMAPPGNNAQHIHQAHLVIQEIEDLVAWQLRLNYDGGQMRPNSVNFSPFFDNQSGQPISFMNLPIDQATFVHRDLVGATDIPAQAPGPQTALMGSTYVGSQTFPVSPDTPAKAPPDDTSYSAASGGVLATLNLQVIAGNAGQSLLMDADDGNPNSPGSGVAVFTGTGQQEILLAETALGDAVHGEGVACQVPTATPPITPVPTETETPPISPTETASPTATPTRTPTPTATPEPNPCRGATGASSTTSHDVSLDALAGGGRIRDSQAKTYTALVTNHNLTGAEDIQVCFSVVPMFGCAAPEIDVALPYDVTPGEPDNLYVDVSGDGVRDSVALAVARGVLPDRTERVKATVFFSSCPPPPNQQQTPFDYIVQADACHEGDPAPKGFFGACPGSSDGANDPNQNNDAPIQKAVNDVLR